MTKKHIGNKTSDGMSIRKGKSLYEELIKKYGIEGETFSDQMVALAEHLRSHDGVETSETKENSRLETEKTPELVVSPLDYECHYRAYNPKTGKFYCDGKQIDPYVCMNRHGRFASMEKRCYPKGMTFRRPRKPRGSQDKDEWCSEQGEIYRGSPVGYTSRTW